LAALLAVANIVLVTLPAPIVAAKEPVPEPVTSPVKEIVWSPVLVPERLDPVIAPEAARVVTPVTAPASLIRTTLF
jgi:hypothetical protein